MIYTARELLIKLTYLQLFGQNEDGELEFVGSREQWDKVRWAEDGCEIYDPTSKKFNEWSEH